ncbi:MAG: YigZ family protein [Flavobacteriales bacterium]|nr:YigZ family protein [Flavobacteriales bacterium]
MRGSDSDHYRAPSGVSEGEYKEKGSKFPAYLFPVSDEDDVNDALEKVRQLHPAAQHHCYAYRLDPDSGAYRVNDDGEPSGSAGKPIYGQLLSFEVHECLIVVVRYFGGVKLGVGGLITAYKEAAKMALDAVSIEDQWLSETFVLRYGYENTSDVQCWLHHKEIELENPRFEASCYGSIRVPRSRSEEIETELQGLTFVELISDH